ncbi:Superfamily I DNA or RNA helicase [Alkalithermobacter thermoalcaliphilus JW-YL-7 = DSM 7308]|uniref:Superfamily I DNA or RNA helicase n=1 Tax=Alkalithermobacter thermoalcaliphilus JW-YL-7 = DSM 7308 TaxID=1121328 RepID=A0A150FPD5_CLOPD|nr:hypothetical protein JWYL7_0576 [[Clostridium] paradoxum JW-YL-7 = DSM 7308]SHK49348.1 Superfamily I DNA or RNA helicase [[Clostridium] paradoxum JW-YL-7 = DSM 7308]
MNDTQKRIVNYEFDTNCIVVNGSSATGKTTIAIERYRHMIENENIKSEQILVLVLNRIQSLIYRSNLDIKGCGEIKITSYFGFIQKELIRFWPLVVQKCDLIGKDSIKPVFHTFETSQCLMNRLVEFKRNKEGLLLGLNSPSDRIAISVISNLTKASLPSISIEEIGTRLYNSLENKDLIKQNIFKDMDNIIDYYIKRCLEKGIIDYGISVFLYNKYLLNDPLYKEYLVRNIKHLIVDNLEECTPSQIDFIKQLIPYTKTSLLLYNPDGGFGIRHGADPLYTKMNIVNKYKNVSLDYSYSKNKFYDFQMCVSNNIVNSTTRKIEKYEDIYISRSEFRSDMIESLTKQVVTLLKQGIKPKDIAVISPVNDIVFEYVLSNNIKQLGYEVLNISRKSSIVDNPYSYALVILACLCYEFEKVNVNEDDVKNLLLLLMNIDPIRVSILIKHIYENKDNIILLKEIKDEKIKDRVGDRYIEKYEFIRKWIENYKQGERLNIDEFFRKVYLEILITLPAGKENINACREIVDSATNFINIISKFESIKDPNLEFIKFIKSGAKSNESIYTLEERLSSSFVTLATPSTYLASGSYNKIHIWADLGNDMWSPRNVTELENPYVLTKTWNINDIYTEDIEEKNRKRYLNIIFKSLIGRCKDKLYLFDSIYSASGYEQSGILLDAIINAFGGDIIEV